MHAPPKLLELLARFLQIARLLKNFIANRQNLIAADHDGIWLLLEYGISLDPGQVQCDIRSERCRSQITYALPPHRSSTAAGGSESRRWLEWRRVPRFRRQG